MITEVDAPHAETVPSKQASRQGDSRRSRPSDPRKSSSRDFDRGETRAELYPVEFDVHRVDPAATKVVRRLTSSGFEAYLVGGCVRDLLIGRQPKDFDVATSARPDDVRRLFRNSRIIGRRFRLV